MPFATRGSFVWLGMILSGIALAVYVLSVWPDTSTRLIRLPYGESLPKTPRVAAEAPVVKTVQAAPAPVSSQPEAELTVAEPASEPVRAPAAAEPAPEVVPEAELVPEESAFELGAEPLPGMGQSQPAEKKPAAAPTQAAPTAQPESAPAPEEPPLLEINVGSPQPFGQE